MKTFTNDAFLKATRIDNYSQISKTTKLILLDSLLQDFFLNSHTKYTQQKKRYDKKGKHRGL
jgi:hypothetical protein